MIISQEHEELRAALVLQSKCELKQIGLRQCHVSLEGSEQTLKKPFSLPVSFNSTANAITDGVLRIEVRFQIQCYDSSETPSLLFNVECAFDIDYELDDKTFQPAPESIAAFKDGTAIFNCWPYAREFVQSMTGRMGIHPSPLPLLRMVPKKKPEQVAASATTPVRRRRRLIPSSDESQSQTETPSTTLETSSSPENH
jgi:hypothetical protein